MNVGRLCRSSIFNCSQPLRRHRAGGDPICIDLSNYLLFCFFKLLLYKGNALTAKQAAKRRLISLIYACWLTHDKGSSWSCPSLVSRIIPLPDASWIPRGFSNRCQFCCKCIAFSFLHSPGYFSYWMPAALLVPLPK